MTYCNLYGKILILILALQLFFCKTVQILNAANHGLVIVVNTILMLLKYLFRERGRSATAVNLYNGQTHLKGKDN